MSIPRDYCYLDSTSMLAPVDLVTLAEELAGFLDCGRDDLTGWYRSLALALFERFKLVHLPQHQAVVEATCGTDLLKVLGVAQAPDHRNALGRAWAMRKRLLALPDFEAGLIEGRPFLLAIGRNVLPEPVRPLAKEVSDSLLAHARQAIELTRKLDRTILVLWGCPVEALEQRVSVAELEASGLKLQTFDP